MVFNDHLVIEERTNGLNRIQLIQLSTDLKQIIELDEETYSLGFAMNDDYYSAHFYFTYTSLSTPSSVFEYNLLSGERKLIHQKELIDPNFNSRIILQKEFGREANDGTLIPVSLVMKKGIDMSKAPLLLYGYGSYGYTIPDAFSPTRLSLLDRGFIFALAHIRGGKYLGESWYENGKFDKKKNTFTDFINAAEFLGHHGYCNPKSICAPRRFSRRFVDGSNCKHGALFMERHCESSAFCGCFNHNVG